MGSLSRHVKVRILIPRSAAAMRTRCHRSCRNLGEPFTSVWANPKPRIVTRVKTGGYVKEALGCDHGHREREHHFDPEAVRPPSPRG